MKCDPDDIVEICELTLAVPSYRRKTRLIAKLRPAFWNCELTEKNLGRAEPEHYLVHFILQYQHDGEPDTWLDDPSFPWHSANLDSIESRQLAWGTLGALTWQHIKISMVATFFVLVVAIPLGILVTRPRWKRVAMAWQAAATCPASSARAWTGLARCSRASAAAA